MTDPAVALDQALERWCRAQAYAKLGRDVDAVGEAMAAEEWLLSGSAADALGEAESHPVAASAAHAAVRAHLRRIASLRADRDLRAILDETLRGNVRVGENAMPFAQALPRVFVAEPSEVALLRRGIDEALDRFVARCGSLRANRDAPTPDSAEQERLDAVRTSARAWLQATEGVFEEVLVYLRPTGQDGTALMRSLVFGAGDGPFAVGGRWRRLGSSVAALRFERELQARVRVEDPRRAFLGAGLAIVGAPLDVRIVPSRLELGVLSEMLDMEAFGRALAHCLVAPALPTALRRPPFDFAARLVGATFAQILVEKRTHERLDRGFRERAIRVAGAFWIARGRWLAACALLERPDRGAREALADHLGLDVGDGWPWIEVFDGAVASRFEAHRLAFEAWAALREQFNEDWYRNPRAAEAIRAVASWGGAITVDALRRELGCREGDAERRVLELFRA